MEQADVFVQRIMKLWSLGPSFSTEQALLSVEPEKGLTVGNWIRGQNVLWWFGCS